MKFKADRYILEQIWKEFKEKVICRDRKRFKTFLEQFEGTELYEYENTEIPFFTNGVYVIFPATQDLPKYTATPASPVLKEWIKKNYPEYLL